MNSLTCLAVLCVVLAASSASTIVKRAAGCTADGNSYPSGSYFYSPPDSCFNYTCDDGHPKFVSGGCKGINDRQCHKPGTKWDEGCTTYRCEQTDTSEGSSYATKIDSVGCQDADGNCRKPGDIFPRIINGKRYNKCGCTVTGNSVSYSCSG